MGSQPLDARLHQACKMPLVAAPAGPSPTQALGQSRPASRPGQGVCLGNRRATTPCEKKTTNTLVDLIHVTGAFLTRFQVQIHFSLMSCLYVLHHVLIFSCVQSIFSTL